MVNWTFAYNNYKDGDVADDLGYARYPETVAGEQSKPPIGGINVGVSPYGSHVDLAMDAVKCITSEKEQVRYAIETANMPARKAAYDDAELRKQFPADLLELWQQSIDTAGPAAAVPVLGDDRERDAQQVAPGGLGQPGLDAGVLGELHRGRPAGEGAPVTRGGGRPA